MSCGRACHGCWPALSASRWAVRCPVSGTAPVSLPCRPAPSPPGSPSTAAAGQPSRSRSSSRPKGGVIADITVGDCLELMEIRDTIAGTLDGGKGAGFYQLLHAMGIFPPDAPATLRMLDPRFQGQLSTAELIDQYALSCPPY